MNENFEQVNIWKGLAFWTTEIEKAGIIKSLKFFNDVVVEKRPPHPEAGYSKPVFVDVVLDGKKSDIYHSDIKEEDTLHRLYIYIKE